MDFVVKFDILEFDAIRGDLEIHLYRAGDQIDLRLLKSKLSTIQKQTFYREDYIGLYNIP